MENVLYRRLIVPARESADGDSAAYITVTQESNGFAVWREDSYNGNALIQFHSGIDARENALEHAVHHAEELLIVMAEAKAREAAAHLDEAQRDAQERSEFLADDPSVRAVMPRHRPFPASR